MVPLSHYKYSYPVQLVPENSEFPSRVYYFLSLCGIMCYSLFCSVFPDVLSVLPLELRIYLLVVDGFSTYLTTLCMTEENNRTWLCRSSLYFLRNFGPHLSIIASVCTPRCVPHIQTGQYSILKFSFLQCQDHVLSTNPDAVGPHVYLLMGIILLLF